jgi:hypothetical protein
MKSTITNWDEQLSAPSTRLEHIAPWLALALAGLLAWL